MDSLDIGEWIRQFTADLSLSPDQEFRLVSLFGEVEDTTDSALKILIPLLLAYCYADGQYPGTEPYIVAQITENSRLKIAINIPIQLNNILPVVAGQFGQLKAQ